VNWPEVKAPRLQKMMSEITEERGNLDLNFACDLTIEEAAIWLNAKGISHHVALSIIRARKAFYKRV